MPAWLLPAATFAANAAMAWLSHKGATDTNKANAAQAQKAMDFSERMSSTAVQRSVEDYRRAGLNPGLAYERSASSPGGVSAVMGDAINTGVNSAQRFREAQQSMKIAREMAEYQKVLIKEQAGAAKAANQQATTQAQLNIDNSNLARQTHAFNTVVQPMDARARLAEAILRELAIPGARNTAGFEELIGRTGKGIGSAKTAAEIIKLLRGGRRD